jgi:hypothetical protein
VAEYLSLPLEEAEPTMPSIFLSHSRRDKSFARALSERLQAQGIRTWLDEAEMRVGDSLIGKISTAIQEFTYLGVVLSPHSVESPWVHLEVRTALTEEIQQRRVKVLPLLYQQCNIPPFLRDKIYADFTADFESGLQSVLSRLTADLHAHEHRKKRALENLLVAYQDWISFNRRDADLLGPEKLRLAFEYLELDGLAPDLLEYLVRSKAIVADEDLLGGLERLASALSRLDKHDGERVITSLLAEGSHRVRLAAARLLSNKEFGDWAPSRLILERLGTESDPLIRRALLVCAYQHGWKLPEDLTVNLLREETDWLSRSYVLRSLPGSHRALLISDGTEFASQLAELADTEGFEVVTMPPFVIFTENEALEDHVLDAYHLVIFVRGEHFTKGGMHGMYDWLRRFAMRGGTLLTTSWVGWETHGTEFAAVLPFEQQSNTYYEDVLITCRSTRLGPERPPFEREFSFRTSFELMHAKPETTVLLETDKGIPILGYQPFGNGLSYYLNTCQHSCLGFATSPLRQSPELVVCLQHLFKNVRARHATHPESNTADQGPAPRRL